MKFETSDLNEGQKETFDLLADFLKDKGDSMVVLKGYAGTGKTYLMKRFIKYVNQFYPRHKIAVTAPTNKAVFVLSKSSIGDGRVSYQTIHKLLGLKEVIHNDGLITFENETGSKNEISMYKIVIVDEVSMLDDELFLKIQQYADRIKIIFVGDPAQIPPVNRPDCIPFNDEKSKYYSFITSSLTEIMRQKKGNPIIEAAFKIRNNLTKRNPIEEVKTEITDEGTGIIRIDPNKALERDMTMDLFTEYFKCKDFEMDSDHAKVIAWRNKTVDKSNKIIREIIFGINIPKIMVGEKLIARKPITEGFSMIIFPTNSEFTVAEYDIANDIFTTPNGSVRLKYYDTIVNAIDIEGKEYQRNIRILHEDSQHDFDRISDSLKKTAIESKGANRSWQTYYGFQREFANVNYNYSGTSHTSQGSTYKNVFVIEDDINANPNLYEKNRILYTSYSRASERLFILKR